MINGASAAPKNAASGPGIEEADEEQITMQQLGKYIDHFEHWDKARDGGADAARGEAL